MTHSIVFNNKPIEELEKPELLKALEAVCNRTEAWKQSAEHWKKKYEEEVKK